MGITRAVLVCVMLCNAVRADFFSDNFEGDAAAEAGIAQGEEKSPRVSHRVQLLFPLLLRISARLAALVPTAITGLIGIFLFVAFSKKAFLISLLVLFLTYLDKYKRDDSVIHIYKINRYGEGEEDVRYGRPYQKVFVHVGKEPPEHRPVPYYKARARLGKPQRSWTGLRRRGRYEGESDEDRTVATTEPRRFLSQSIDAGGASLRWGRKLKMAERKANELVAANLTEIKWDCKWEM